MTTDLEARLRSALEAEATVVKVPADMVERIEARRRRPGSQGWLRLAAAAVVVLVLGVAVMVARTDGGKDNAVTADDPPLLEVGSWSTLPAAPIGPRHDHAGMWTGEELLVFGGIDIPGGDQRTTNPTDAAAYDPSTGEWRELTAPAGLFVNASSTVWTGEKVVSIGCLPENPCTAGGAAYDPASDTWTPIAHPGDALPMPGGLAVMTDAGVLALVEVGHRGSPSFVEGPTALGAGLYDPATDSWRPLSDMPVALEVDGTFWTGTEAIVVGTLAEPDADGPDPVVAYALDLAAGTWRELPAPPLPATIRTMAVWTGTEVVVVDQDGAAAFDPTSETWRPLTAPPLPLNGRYWHPEAVAVGQQVVIFGTADETLRPLVLDVTTDTWALGPATDGPELIADGELPYRLSLPLVSTGDAVLLWGGGVPIDNSDGGSSCCRSLDDGLVFAPGP